MKLVKEPTKKSKIANSNYNGSKNNAVKYGIFAKHSVMHWENKDDYDSILNDLIEEYQPNNLTERHLVVELANIIWSKMRLKYAEKSSLQKELNENVNGFFSTNKAEQALLQNNRSTDHFNIKKLVVDDDNDANLELIRFKECSKCCDESISVLNETNDYEKGLCALHLEDQENWKDAWDNYEEGVTFDTVENLIIWIKQQKIDYEKIIYQLENKTKVKDQVLGSTFLPDKTMDKYIRYENHLDKKFEKTLTVFFKLRDIRNNGVIS